MIVGYTLLPEYTELWQLVDECQTCLGPAAALLAMGEEATDSHLGDWADFPRKAWQRGRVFGPYGEVQWRRYGAQVRAVILVDRVVVNGRETTDEHSEPGQAILDGLQALSIVATVHTPYEVEDEVLFLWRGDYATALMRRYKDAEGVDSFVRYCTATPAPPKSTK